ncbi:MAG: TonB-dependent receptor, partial [Stenotrophomonas nitritireducens]|nr:TonB-dependent receptor [Stenotrophomonas nitritireducens]
MYLKSTPLRSAIALALATACSAPALAQSGNDGTTTLDRVEITGSRIRQASVDIAKPVIALSRAEIEKKGYVNVADILQDVTAAGAPALSRASALSSARDYGGMFV